MAKRSNKSIQAKKSDTRSVKEKKSALLEALRKTLGVITEACEKAGVCRDTFYRYKSEDEEFRRRYEEIDEIAIDFVESKMFQLIKGGDRACVMFFMKCRAKKRGYIEKEEKQVSNVPQIIIQNDLSKDTNN